MVMAMRDADTGIMEKLWRKKKRERIEIIDICVSNRKSGSVSVSGDKKQSISSPSHGDLTNDNCCIEREVSVATTTVVGQAE